MAKKTNKTSHVLNLITSGNSIDAGEEKNVQNKDRTEAAESGADQALQNVPSQPDPQSQAAQSGPQPQTVMNAESQPQAIQAAPAGSQPQIMPAESQPQAIQAAPAGPQPQIMPAEPQPQAIQAAPAGPQPQIMPAESQPQAIQAAPAGPQPQIMPTESQPQAIQAAPAGPQPQIMPAESQPQAIQAAPAGPQPPIMPVESQPSQEVPAEPHSLQLRQQFPVTEKRVTVVNKNSENDILSNKILDKLTCELSETEDQQEEETYRMVNVMEQILKRQNLNQYMKNYGVCTCSRCYADVEALILTRLPAKYVVVDYSTVTPIIGFYESKYKIRILTEIVKSCLDVKDCPRHSRPGTIQYLEK